MKTPTIIETSGDLFEGNPEVLVNPVNCEGVMGAGLALQFKKRFPKMFLEYKQICKDGLLQPGGIYIHAQESTGNPLYIISAATKNKWRNDSEIDWIYSICDEIRRWSYGLQHEHLTIHIPALGCGLGGLPYANVRIAVFESLEYAKFDCVKLFRPHNL